MHTIDHVIIHKLVKEKHGKPTVVERSDALPTSSEPVKKLVDDIHHLYTSRTGKGYGRFESDEINYPSAAILRKVFKDKTTTFVDASKQLLSVLAKEAGQAALATGGYILMAQVSNPAKVSWFIVAIINNVHGSAIDDVSMEVVDSVHVDLENFRVAGRVNLNDWLSEDSEARYVGFLKQRGDVADYFKRFLGCNELIADTEETKKLITALKNYAKSEELDREQEEAFLKVAYNFCHECNKNDEPLSLDALANAIWPTNPKKLQTALASSDVQLSDGFVPDGRVIRAFLKIKAKTPYWTLDLDRHALITGDARYIKAKGELVLSNLPKEFKAELDSEMGNDN